MRKILLYIFVFVLGQEATAQNLVRNPSFEEYINCPYDYTHVKDSVKELLPFWYVANNSTPDYFNSCCRNEISGVPKNFAGKMEAKTGNAYAGIILKVNQFMYKGSEYYKEYLQCSFSESLKRNQLYCCGFNVAFAQASGLAVDAIGMSFSNDQINLTQKSENVFYTPEIENTEGNILKEKDKWILISGVYRAEGEENYLTIGNFKSVYQTKTFEIKQTKTKAIDQYAYYYIDDVFVFPINSVDECKCTTIKNVRDSFPNIEIEQNKEQQSDSIFKNPQLGSTIILNNIYFDFDKSVLLKESSEELDKLYKMLNEYPKMEIMIYGYTDNIGSDSYNIILSEKRAKAVFEYLFYKGIDFKRMNYLGMGNSNAVFDNNLKSGREKNRRVEVEIIKM